MVTFVQKIISDRNDERYFIADDRCQDDDQGSSPLFDFVGKHAQLVDIVSVKFRC
jgi:hypothetical protein